MNKIFRVPARLPADDAEKIARAAPKNTRLVDFFTEHRAALKAFCAALGAPEEDVDAILTDALALKERFDAAMKKTPDGQ
ncbi:MAG: hypothetical protein LBM17_02635 [Candidatus Accumulibacter sp.]|nr:hypothetical protein [Accumulibacter sp.]